MPDPDDDDNDNHVHSIDNEDENRIGRGSNQPSPLNRPAGLVDHGSSLFYLLVQWCKRASQQKEFLNHILFRHALFLILIPGGRVQLSGTYVMIVLVKHLVVRHQYHSWSLSGT